jgi:hypothetical protein
VMAARGAIDVFMRKEPGDRCDRSHPPKPPLM